MSKWMMVYPTNKVFWSLTEKVIYFPCSEVHKTRPIERRFPIKYQRHDSSKI